MKRSTLLYFLVSLTLSSALYAAAESAGPDLDELTDTARATANDKASIPPCTVYNELNNGIRDGRIARSAAKAELTRILAAVRQEYYLRGGKDHPVSEWVFPVSGYDLHAIDGGRTHGFVTGGYDFFSGNLHGGHPALDIFIRDRNRDNLDDHTGKPVRVLSMTGGIVVALEKDWEPSGKLRGGKYIWVYEPAGELLVYYAHNDQLLVELGQVVKPGTPLATIGRSGLNAARRRSPTHLHLSVLKVIDGKPLPLDIYPTLRQSIKTVAK